MSRCLGGTGRPGRGGDDRIDGLRQENIWDAGTARRYDAPGEGMFAPEVLGPTVERLAELAAGSRVLEFAVGTGRVAAPLAQRGVPVEGIELSAAMVPHQRPRTPAPGGQDRAHLGQDVPPRRLGIMTAPVTRE